MISNNIPSNLGNLVAPFLPAGQRPVGQETAASRNSTFKPVEQSAKTAETRVRRKAEQDQQEQDQREKQGQQREALAEQIRSKSEKSNPEQAPETPSSRLAQRFAGADVGNPLGSHFDQTI